MHWPEHVRGLGKAGVPYHTVGMSNADTIDLLAHRRNRLMNTLHTWLLAAGSLALLAVTAWAFGGTAGVVYALVFGGISLWLARRVSPQMVLAMYKARPVSEAEFPAGVQIVRELARRADLPSVPKLFVVPSKMMNAFAVGRRQDSVIAVTDALVRTLSARELAGVLAHETSHIAHEDLKVMALADIVSRFTSIMSTVGILSLLVNLGSFAGGSDEAVPWLAVLVLIAAPTVGGLLQMALSRTREFDADLGAAMLTGDPDGLASALRKLERAHGRLWEGLMLPGGRIPNPSVLRTHPQTEERVARLMGLKAAPGGPDAGGFPAGREVGRSMPRPSLVPKVGRHPGPSFPTGLRGGIAALTDAPPFEPTDDAADLEPIDDELPACNAPLNPPQGNPRIRIERGGVWW
jgi:heat shock protein HtpX